MIKTKRLIALLFAVFALCSTTGMQAQTLDIDRQLKYCSTQVNRALDELRHKDGTYDYTMQPRNILNGDRQKGWNCRPAKAEEWCDGFWPGILWMTYQTTGDEAVRRFIILSIMVLWGQLCGFTSRGQLNIVPTIGLNRVASESADARITSLYSREWFTS